MDEETRRRLERHHGGPDFPDVIVRNFARRFGDEFWTRWRDQVARHHGPRPVYVDLGTGPGLMLEAWRERWPDAQLHGVESQPYMLETARAVAARVGATVHEADLHTLRLPLPDASVDGVLFAMVIHELREPIGALREVARLLGAEGRMILADWTRVPLRQYLADRDDDPFADGAGFAARAGRIDHFMEHNKFTRGDLEWILERLGFAVEHTEVRGDGQFVWLTARRR